ncbi:MAG: 2-phospho-L-lactate transferase [Alphaproteobacteria bacterium]|nr:2-phospho-L-lactate transferase [Alphaproteobacteria bacterium]
MTVVALSGGVGGAKLVAGLADILPPGDLVVVANTGDDFEHLGLHIAPDIDSVFYALAGWNDTERGWGRAGETWNCMAALGEIGAETWFNLGDRDLALHLERTRRLRAGEPLSAVTAALCEAAGIATRIVPMSETPVPTVVHTAGHGDLAFQHYFVRERCAPVVTGFTHRDAERAAVPAALRALRDVEAVVVCPSNPFISIGPILAVPGMAAWLTGLGAPVVAVSPLIGGQAVKGPTAKMFAELGLDVTNAGLVAQYGDRLDGLVIDEADAADSAGLAIATAVTGTLMQTAADRHRVAEIALRLAEAIAEHKG